MLKRFPIRPPTPPRTPASLTVSRDLLPGIGRVHEGGVLDLIVDVLVLVEREGAAQADVHDDAHGPHVQRTVVTFAPQNLGSQIRRGPNHRAAERLLSDDTSETEVAQLHLERRDKTDVTQQRVVELKLATF